jgi:uncharacterized protein YyaL (SSP411 family)
MIAAMAQAAQVLGDARYATAAVHSAEFLLTSLRAPDGRLWHAYKDGQARFNAYLDDYAALIDGLVELYQATFEARWLTEAVVLAESMIERFADRDAGGFYYTSADHEALIARLKDSQDNATPSGNSLAAYALFRLGRLTARTDFEDQAIAVLNMVSGQLARVPSVGGQALMAVDFLIGPTREFVFAAPDGEGVAAMLRDLHARFLPNKVVANRPVEWDDAHLRDALASLLKGKTARNGQPTAYVCRQGACEAPVVGEAAFAESLNGIATS